MLQSVALDGEAAAIAHILGELLWCRQSGALGQLGGLCGGSRDVRLGGERGHQLLLLLTLAARIARRCRLHATLEAAHWSRSWGRGCWRGCGCGHRSFAHYGIVCAQLNAPAGLWLLQRERGRERERERYAIRKCVWLG